MAILRDAGLTDTAFLVEAARLRAARGTCALTIRQAIDLVLGSNAFAFLSKGSADKYRQRWNRFAKHVGEDLLLVQIEEAHIRSHLDKRPKASATKRETSTQPCTLCSINITIGRHRCTQSNG